MLNCESPYILYFLQVQYLAFYSHIHIHKALNIKINYITFDNKNLSYGAVHRYYLKMISGRYI